MRYVGSESSLHDQVLIIDKDDKKFGTPELY
jgi:hypothetical protein